MKWLYAGIAVLVGLPLAHFGAIYAASELGGEVVVLHRKAATGSTDKIRVWIVEDGEGTWIEHGAPDAGWITMLAQDPIITLERQGASLRYRAVADPAAHTRYHSLRREKYGFADTLIEFLTGGADGLDGAPVRIELVP